MADDKSGWGRAWGTVIGFGGVVSAVAAAIAAYSALQQTKLASSAASIPYKIAIYTELSGARLKLIEASSQFDNVLRRTLAESNIDMRPTSSKQISDSFDPELSEGSGEKFLIALADYRSALNSAAFTWPAKDRPRFIFPQEAAFEAYSCITLAILKENERTLEQIAISREQATDACRNVPHKIEHFGRTTSELLTWMQGELDGVRTDLEDTSPSRSRKRDGE